MGRLPGWELAVQQLAHYSWLVWVYCTFQNSIFPTISAMSAVQHDICRAPSVKADSSTATGDAVVEPLINLNMYYTAMQCHAVQLWHSVHL